jgi:hypothetical protein
MAPRPTLGDLVCISKSHCLVHGMAFVCGGNIFKILYTKIIFREIILLPEQLHAESRLK